MSYIIVEIKHLKISECHYNRALKLELSMLMHSALSFDILLPQKVVHIQTIKKHTLILNRQLSLQNLKEKKKKAKPSFAVALKCAIRQTEIFSSLYYFFSSHSSSISTSLLSFSPYIFYPQPQDVQLNHQYDIVFQRMGQNERSISEKYYTKLWLFASESSGFHFICQAGDMEEFLFFLATTLMTIVHGWGKQEWRIILLSL